MAQAVLPHASAACPQHGFRFGFLDLLKTVASNLIVLHHLAFYGPMTDCLRPLAPELFHWFGTQARIAVQVFLVIGGFLAARALTPRGLPGVDAPLHVVARRLLKLMPPYAVAVALAVAASSLAGMWMTHRSVSPPPTPAQLAAHVLLLQDILKYPAQSAGVWYVAIDFQLFALLTLLLWLAGRAAPRRTTAWIVPALVTAGISASLLYFNRDQSWDAWNVYFFGSYGLGALAWWASDPARTRTSKALLLAAMLIPALAGLALEFRTRIAVALLTAIALAVCGRSDLSLSGRRFPLIDALGRISYAVFLVHFSVCLVVNALFARFVPTLPWAQAAGVLLAWSASIAAGAAFYRWVEMPLGRLATCVPGMRAARNRAIGGHADSAFRA